MAFLAREDRPMQDEKLSDEPGRLAALRRYDILDTSDEEAFQRIVELVRSVLDVPMAAVSLVDANREWMKAAVGPLPRQIPREHSFSAEAIGRHGPMAVSSAADDGRFATNPLVTGAPTILAYLGVPLTTPDGYNIGVLCVYDDEPRPFNSRDAGILEKFAQIVLEQLDLRQITSQDAMTGAMSRRGFMAEVDKEFARAHRYDRPSALVMIDVDHFREINARHGYPAGDSVLTAIANAVMSGMRKSDIFGRVGGEEFALLLPETDVAAARDVAERIRKSIEATIIDTGAGDIRATVSLGVAPLAPRAEGAAGWLAEADIALYEAKHLGRNRVEIAERPLGMLMPAARERSPQVAH
jgi:diguanylate cyclase (GGDEF)-like protein